MEAASPLLFVSLCSFFVYVPVFLYALAAKLDAAREKMAAQIAEKEQKLQAELAQ